MQSRVPIGTRVRGPDGRRYITTAQGLVPADQLPAAQAEAEQKAVGATQGQVEPYSERVRTGIARIHTAQLGRSALDDMDTGVWAPLRRDISKRIGPNLAARITGGILPDEHGVAAMEDFEGEISNRLALQEAQALKGALSNADLQFVQRIAPSLTRSELSNRRAMMLSEWIGVRQAQRALAEQGWVRSRGSINNPGRNGESFDSWWERYAAERFPRPDTLPGWNSGRGYRPPRKKTAGGGATGGEGDLVYDPVSGQLVPERGR